MILANRAVYRMRYSRSWIILWPHLKTPIFHLKQMWPIIARQRQDGVVKSWSAIWNQQLTHHMHMYDFIKISSSLFTAGSEPGYHRTTVCPLNSAISRSFLQFWFLKADDAKSAAVISLTLAGSRQCLTRYTCRKINKLKKWSNFKKIILYT